MQFYFIDPRGGKSKVFGLWQGILLSLIFSVLISSGGFYFGSQHGSDLERKRARSNTGVCLAELKGQELKLSELQKTSENRMDALALRLGQLQSQILRMNALGQRVVEKLKISKGEFNFSEMPPRGGGGAERLSRPQTYENLRDQVADLSLQIQDRDVKLSVLDELMVNRDIRKQAYPAGRPLTKGWLSSSFGWRNDPFNGRRAFHHGIDFAGRNGSNVVAVASGLVTSAGKYRGYGNLVAIDHGGGYVTHYAHNKELTVALGDRVNQGDAIAKMGSTGHSTGPHVHFEVLRHGKKINPIKFILTKR